MKRRKLRSTLIREGKVCQYCFDPTEYVDSSEVYGKSYGMIYLCRPCQAWVGVHDGSNVALGIVANKELREAKKQAHYYFDQLWKKKMDHGYSKHEARKSAYKWLSEQLNVPVELCHIGMFTVERCNKTVEICKKYVK